MEERSRDKWSAWITRVPRKEGDRLLQLGKLLVKKHLIPKSDRYNIARFAILLLEQNLFKEYLDLKKKESEATLEE